MVVAIEPRSTLHGPLSSSSRTPVRSLTSFFAVLCKLPSSGGERRLECLFAHVRQRRTPDPEARSSSTTAYMKASLSLYLNSPAAFGFTTLFATSSTFDPGRDQVPRRDRDLKCGRRCTILCRRICPCCIELIYRVGVHACSRDSLYCRSPGKMSDSGVRPA